MVATISILDTFHVYCLCDSFWELTIPGKFHPGLIGYVPWKLVASVLATLAITFIVQSFYTLRVWYLSKRNNVLVLIIGVLILLQIASGTIFSAKEIIVMMSRPPPGAFANTTTLLIQLVTSVACDTVITSSMVYYLSAARADVKECNVSSIRQSQGPSFSPRITEALIQNLIIYSVNLGMIGCLMAFIQLLIFLLKPHTFIFAAPHIICSKCYVNSILATLNSRKSLRQQFFTREETAGSAALPLSVSTKVS
jgi:hypothetical protein